MVFCPATGKRTSKCKVKGITLNYNNSEVVNFTSLRSMILEDDTPLHVHNPKKIKRKHCGVVVSEPETKEYKVKNFKVTFFLTLSLSAQECVPAFSLVCAGERKCLRCNNSFNLNVYVARKSCTKILFHVIV